MFFNHDMSSPFGVLYLFVRRLYKPVISTFFVIPHIDSLSQSIKLFCMNSKTLLYIMFMQTDSPAVIEAFRLHANAGLQNRHQIQPPMLSFSSCTVLFYELDGRSMEQLKHEFCFSPYGFSRFESPVTCCCTPRKCPDRAYESYPHKISTFEHSSHLNEYQSQM